MRADDVASRIELPKLRRVEEPALSDAARRHEAEPSKPQTFEPVGRYREERDPAVVERHDERLRPVFCQSGNLRVEGADRQLVAVGCGRCEAALARIVHEHVMKQQGNWRHSIAPSRPSSTADIW